VGYWMGFSIVAVLFLVPATIGNQHLAGRGKMAVSTFWTAGWAGVAASLAFREHEDWFHLASAFFALACYLIAFVYYISLLFRYNTMEANEKERPEHLNDTTFARWREVLGEEYIKSRKASFQTMEEWDEMFDFIQESFNKKAKEAENLPAEEKARTQKVYSLKNLSEFMKIIAKPATKDFLDQLSLPLEERRIYKESKVSLAASQLETAKKDGSGDVAQFEAKLAEAKMLLEPVPPPDSCPSTCAKSCMQWFNPHEDESKIIEDKSQTELIDAARRELEAEDESPVEEDHRDGADKFVDSTMTFVGMKAANDKEKFFFPSIMLVVSVSVIMLGIWFVHTMENYFKSVDTGLTTLQEQLKTADQLVMMGNHLCPNVYMMSMGKNVTIGMVAAGYTKQVQGLGPDIESFTDAFSIAWRIGEALACVTIIRTLFAACTWYRKIALEVRDTGTSYTHFARYGVTPAEFKDTIVPILTPSMASEFLAQFIYGTGFGCVFIWLFSTVISTIFIWDFTRDKIFSALGPEMLFVIGGKLVQAVILNQIADKFLTTLTKRTETAAHASIQVRQPALFCLYFPMLTIFNCFIGIVDAMKRVFAYLGVFIKVLMRPDRTLLREGGYEKDSLFVSFMATIEMYHNNGSHQF